MGANAEVRRFDIRRGCHVTVIESGKFLWARQRLRPSGRCVRKAYVSSITSTSSLCPRPSCSALFTSSFFLISPRPSASPTTSGQLLQCRAEWSVPPCLTTAQTQYLYVIAKVRLRQCQQCRRKEHCFIVGMGNEEENPLSLQRWEGAAKLRRVQPEAEQQDGHRDPGDPIHGEGTVCGLSTMTRAQLMSNSPWRGCRK